MDYEEEHNTADGKVPEFGAIFMANAATKRESFRRKLFGLPSSLGNFVKQVKKGMILFLFEYEKRELFGVYQASSDGATNLVPAAYSSSGKRFPAQVRFRPIWYCSPLSENEFGDAIRENYFLPTKFNFGLSRYQVCKLLEMFSTRKLKDFVSLEHSPTDFCRGVGKHKRQTVDDRALLIESLTMDSNDNDCSVGFLSSNHQMKSMDRRETDENMLCMEDNIDREDNIIRGMQGPWDSLCQNSRNNNDRIFLADDVRDGELHADRHFQPICREERLVREGRFSGSSLFLKNIDFDDNNYLAATSPENLRGRLDDWEGAKGGHSIDYVEAEKYNNTLGSTMSVQLHEEILNKGTGTLINDGKRLCMPEGVGSSRHYVLNPSREEFSSELNHVSGKLRRVGDDNRYPLIRQPENRFEKKYHDSTLNESEQFRNSRCKVPVGDSRFPRSERLELDDCWHHLHCGFMPEIAQSSVENWKRIPARRLLTRDAVEINGDEKYNLSPTALDKYSAFDKLVDRKIASDSRGRESYLFLNEQGVNDFSRPINSRQQTMQSVIDQKSLTKSKKFYDELEFLRQTEAPKYGTSRIYHDAIITTAMPSGHEVSLTTPGYVLASGSQMNSPMKHAYPYYNQGDDPSVSLRGEIFEKKGMGRPCNLPFDAIHDSSLNAEISGPMELPSAVCQETTGFPTHHPSSIGYRCTTVASLGMPECSCPQNGEVDCGSEAYVSHTVLHDIDGYKHRPALMLSETQNCSAQKIQEHNNENDYKLRMGTDMRRIAGNRSVFTRLSSAPRLQYEGQESVITGDSCMDTSVEEIMGMLQQFHNVQSKKSKKRKELRQEDDGESRKLWAPAEAKEVHDSAVSVTVKNGIEDGGTGQNFDQAPRETRALDFKRRSQTQRSSDVNCIEGSSVKPNSDKSSCCDAEAKGSSDKSFKRRKLIRPTFLENDQVGPTSASTNFYSHSPKAPSNSSESSMLSENLSQAQNVAALCHEPSGNSLKLGLNPESTGVPLASNEDAERQILMESASVLLAREADVNNTSQSHAKGSSNGGSSHVVRLSQDGIGNVPEAVEPSASGDVIATHLLSSENDRNAQKFINANQCDASKKKKLKRLRRLSKNLNMESNIQDHVPLSVYASKV